MSDGFTIDPRYAQVAEAYFLDAVDFANQQLGIELDWSDLSIESVESILEALHVNLQRMNPSPEQIARMAKIFGSYIGEVFRKNHGANWGLVTLNGQTFPGLEGTKRDSVLFWPWGRVENRLLDGAENNVWHYYCALLEKNGTPFTPPKATKKTLWQNLRGA